MKKLNTSVSPFLILIFPVLLFVATSFAISKETTQINVNTPMQNLECKTKTVINKYPKSLIQLLLN